MRGGNAGSADLGITAAGNAQAVLSCQIADVHPVAHGHDLGGDGLEMLDAGFHQRIKGETGAEAFAGGDRNGRSCCQFLEAVEFVGIDRLLKPVNVELLHHLCKLECILPAPCLVGIDSDLHILANGITNQLHALYITLHIPAKVGTDLHFQVGEALITIMGNLLHDLLIGGKTADTAGINGYLIPLGTEIAMQRQACLLGHDIIDSHIEIAYFGGLSGVKVHVSNRPVQTMVPFPVRHGLAGQNSGQDDGCHITAAGNHAPSTITVIELEPGTQRAVVVSFFGGAILEIDFVLRCREAVNLCLVEFDLYIVKIACVIQHTIAPS